MDWLALLAVQGTLKSLLQHHSSKASILQCSTFFTVQLSHPYTGAPSQADVDRPDPQEVLVSKEACLQFYILAN